MRMGWKDTVITYPGEVTRIVVRWAETDYAVNAVSAGSNAYTAFDPTAALIGGVGYVWHCHIVDHEDNEMMRPYIVMADKTANSVTNKSISRTTEGAFGPPHS